MSTSFPVYEFGLMQDYRLAGPFTGNTELAIVTTSSGVEVFTIGADGKTIWNLRQDPSSVTGWTSYALPPLPAPASGSPPLTITAVAATADSSGQRIVVIGASSGELFVMLEDTSSSHEWQVPRPSFKTLDGTPSRLRLRCRTASPFDDCVYLTAGYVVANWEGVTKWLIYGGVIQTLAAQPTWDCGLCFNSDTGVTALYFPNASDGSGPSPMVAGIVSPTLAVVKVSDFVPSVVWTTAGSAYSSISPVSVWRAQPRGGDQTFVLGDYACGSDKPAGLPPGASVLCAGAIDDYTGASTSMAAPQLVPLDPILIPAVTMTRMWDNHGAAVDETMMLQPSSTNANYTPAGWIFTDYRGGGDVPITCPGGKITFSGQDAYVGLVNTKVQVAPPVASKPLFDAQKVHANAEPLQMYSVVNQGQSTGNFMVSLHSGVSPFTWFIPFTTQRSPGVIHLARMGEEMSGNTLINTVVGSLAASNSQAFSNSCFVSQYNEEASADIFAVDDQGKLWQCASTQGTPPYSWTQPPSFLNLNLAAASSGGTTLAATMTSDGTVHIFAVGRDEILYHAFSTPSGFNTPLNIAEQVASIALVPPPPGVNALDAPRLFVTSTQQATGSGGPAVYHMALGETDWNTTPVTLGDSAQPFQPFYSYSANIRLFESDGGPLSNTAVALTSSDTVCAVINGQAFRLLQQAPATVTTDNSGILHIVLPALDIAAPLISVSLTAGSPVLVSFRPNRYVVEALSGYPSSVYYNSQGTGVLQGDFGNQATADAITPAIQLLGRYAFAATMKQESQTPATTAAAVPGDDPPDGAWTLTFNGTAPPTFTPSDGATGVVALPKKTLSAALGSTPDTSGITDPVENAGDTVKQISKVSITKAGDAMTIAIEIAAGAFTETFQVTDRVEDLLSVTAAIFRQVGVTTQQLVQWLAFNFDWQAIKRTAGALDYALSTFFALVQRSTSSPQTTFDNNFQTLSGKISNNFDTAVTTLNNTNISALVQSIQDKQRSGTPLPIVEATLLMKPLLALAKQATPPAVSSSLSALTQSIRDSGNSINTSQEFPPPVSTFSRYFPSADGTLTATLNTILPPIKSLVTGGLSLTKSVVDTVLSNAADLTSIQTALGTPLPIPGIPWVSDLYALQLGGSLTASSLMSFVAAIPATVLFKALKGRPPIESDGALTDFKSILTTDQLAAIWGGATSSAGTVPADALSRMQDAALYLSLAAGAVRLFLDPQLDADSVKKATGPESYFLSVADLSSSFALLASGICNAIAGMIESPNSAPSILTTAGITIQAASFLLNAAMTCGVGAVALLEGDPGVALDVLINTTVNTIAAVSDGMSGATDSLEADVIGMVAGFGRFGLFSAQPQPESVAVTMAADVVSDTFSLYVTAVNASGKPATQTLRVSSAGG